MKTLNADLKNGTFRRMYLLYGEEEFLKQSYKTRFRDNVTGGDTMNITSFEGKDIDEDAVIDAADTMPFFSERRLIIIEDSGWFKSAPDKFVTYLDRMPETTCIVFSESDVDKRNRLYKKVKDTGYICELTHPSPSELSRWAAGILAKSGKKITASTMDLFLSYTGNDMENIRNELEKLISYLGDRDVVERSDVDTVTTVTVTNRIFDMVREITASRTKEALVLYEDLLTLKEPPMRILYLIAKQFNQLLEVKEMAASGSSRDDIAKEIRVPQFVAGKLMAQAKGFDRNALLSYVKKCVELEEAVKTGNIPERLAVELVITGDRT